MLTKLYRHIDRFFTEDEALAVTEYAVMLSLIVIAAMGALTVLGVKITNVFRFEYEAIDAVVN